MCFSLQRRALFRPLHFQKRSERVEILTLWCQICFAPQRRELFRRLNFQMSSEPDVFWHFLLPKVLRATAACTFSTSQLPKVVRTRPVWHSLFPNAIRTTMACSFSTSQLPKVVQDRRALTLFDSKCASRHNGAHFSTSQLPKVVRTWCALTTLTWKCAWRHNGVQFFIPHLSSYLCTGRFSEPTFQPSEATKHWKKHSVSQLSYLSRTCIFSLLTFSISDLLHLLSSPFWLSTRLNFFLAVLSICPYCRKFSSSKFLWQRSTGTCFVQAFVVVQRGTAAYFVQAL